MPREEINTVATKKMPLSTETSLTVNSKECADTELPPQDAHCTKMVQHGFSKMDKETSNKSGRSSPTNWRSNVETNEGELVDPKPGFVTTVQRENIFRNCATNKIVVETLHQARFFVVRDEFKTVVEAMKQEKWCANRYVLKVLNNAFVEQARRGRTLVYVLFHVMYSDYFAGVAQMTSTADFKNYSLNYSSLVSTSSQVCHGEFSLRWVYVHSLPFESAVNSQFSPGYDNIRSIKTLKGGKEIPNAYGAWLLKRFDEHTSNHTVLDNALVLVS